MPNVVCAGAMLTCIQGIAPATLLVLPINRVMIEGKPAANIKDHIPLVNIPPFGMCRSLANPTVAAATAAAMGVLTPMPCLPVIPAPWLPGALRTRIAGMPALTLPSTCQCQWGGVIRIVQPGSLRTQVA
ncbi:DUF4280 domain-containing protein [Pantoea sp. LS15]|uniref:DUF4280 domain-containing protein n=1 Tax=Enterobacterales TaxID=91347 RepID=UPI000E0E5275|nr:MULTISPECIES: DUF4280 domain-containing protein [Enterobacterales]NJQ21801.1 DUF4280 domain-containing protein [Pantoea sp. LS15]NKF48397.1 DUF4280 domain-containing protein [Pantoea sp. LS15]RDK12955.1 DUF4280 domain-containing protein [Enterobacter sp. 9-2]